MMLSLRCNIFVGQVDNDFDNLNKALDCDL